jgi:hypothetical protein
VVVGDEAVGGLISLLLNNNAISTMYRHQNSQPHEDCFHKLIAKPTFKASDN